MLVTPIDAVTPDGRRVYLTVGRVYEVLGVEADSYRVLTDEDTPNAPNDPVLYEPECFWIVDAAEPSFWQTKRGDNGERYAYPAEWGEAGFFEDYHDGVAAVRELFWKSLQNLYPRTHKERQRAGQNAAPPS